MKVPVSEAIASCIRRSPGQTGIRRLAIRRYQACAARCLADSLPWGKTRGQACDLGCPARLAIVRLDQAPCYNLCDAASLEGRKGKDLLGFLVSWPGGSLEATLKLIATVVIAYAVVVWISAVIWVYRDVKSRTNDPLSQAVGILLVSLFNLPGLMVYLVIRPQDTLADAFERSLEAEALLDELRGDPNSCQNCRQSLEGDFKICPNCKTVVREPCTACGRLVRTNWIACPYCAMDRAVSSPRPPRGARPQDATDLPPLQRPSRQSQQGAPGTATRPR